MNYFQLLYYTADYGVRIYKQLMFIKSFLLPKVDAACNRFDYHPSKKEKDKIRFYYPLFNHVVNCETYLTIKNRPRSRAETERLALLSVSATLYDDFIDEEKWSSERLMQIFEKKISQANRTPKINVLMAIDDELKSIYTPSAFYNDSLKLAINWQITSAKQLDSDISLAEVLHISKEKCGNSSLLWASILDEQWTEKEKCFIHQSGFVGQLVNDAYDAIKDIQDGGYTYIRKASSVAEAKKIFINECRNLNQTVRDCSIPERNKIKTIRRMACIHAFGLVALTHLEKIDTKYARPIYWQNIKRSDLITDMDFWNNRVNVLKFALFLAKL